MCKSPIDARVIAIDETQHYALPEKHKPYIQAIRGVYLYDANQRVHCCELTASHYLIFLYNSVILTEAGKDLDDEVRGELYDEYEYNCPGEDIYVHCAEVERYAKATATAMAAITAKATATGDYLDYGATEVSYDESDYDEQIEDLIESLTGNPPF